MESQEFTYLLEHPESMTGKHTEELAIILQRFPFLQSANALFLKGLKNENSPFYNQRLKYTAAQTQDRAILFDFITSAKFNQQYIGKKIREREKLVQDIEVVNAHDVSEQVENEELEKANAVLDPGFFIPKNPSEESLLGETISKRPEEDALQRGKPLEFTKKETHSFTEWLKITSFDPIERSLENTENLGKDPDRSRRIRLIDKFISTNPKIKVKPIDETKKITIDDKNIPADSLMTETLARVYVEQKNYKKAKQAFKILSLKYPEKSGFFADQIRAIEELQENKNQ